MNTSSSVTRLEQLREAAVPLFEEGLSKAEIARRLGVSRPAVSSWYQQWQAHGPEGLRLKPQGAQSRLTEAQWQDIVECLLAGPAANGYDTQLWTLARIADLIEQRTGVRYNSNYVAALMHRQGWTCQKPARRAKERNEEAIGRWLEQTWPSIKRGPSTSRPH
jgi:transposase